MKPIIVPTERANGSYNAQWLPVASCLHILGNLQDLTHHLLRNVACSFGHL